MSPTFRRIAAALGLLLVAGCGRDGGRAGQAAQEKSEAASYLAPPAAAAYANGVLSGTAAPGAQVRLATPSGEATITEAGRDGRWQVRLPPAAAARIFGLSMTAGGRQVQAQGYVLVAPGGQAAALRSGGGSIRLDRQRPGMGTLDFDRGGGAVLSGPAPPGAVVLVRQDGRQVAEGRADAAGRFSIALPPADSGRHRLEVFGDGFQDAAVVETQPAPPLAGGPLRSQLSGAGLRADWLTPGGGVQSTVLID
ncbi:Ig-like domain-containing protein [Phenylobacterium sp.]|uniref:Ig-like domain-containing protein n=1 Tax=Phenylobacterium sp. TaxID=1871053 RepID=UPI002F938E7C